MLLIEKLMLISISMVVMNVGEVLVSCVSVGVMYVYSVNIVFVLSIVVVSVFSMIGCVSMVSLVCRLGILLVLFFGNVVNRLVIVIRFRFVVVVNDMC